MSYVNAPATKMVATYCACCARDLVDAISVETGVGPECRKKHGFADAQGEPNYVAVDAAIGRLSPETFAIVNAPTAPREDARALANLATHRIAIAQTGADVAALTAMIAALGFTKLAARIAKRIGIIEITREGDTFKVKAPFSEAFNVAVCAVPGQRWVKEEKVRAVPVSARVALYEALKRSFPAGMMVQGPLGLAAL